MILESEHRYIVKIMAKPYVYLCTHRDTKRFYIGYRRANVVPALEDLGTNYYTSSDEVKRNFNEFDYEILSEYDSPLMAFEVEQVLIYENRHNQLLINKNYKTKNHITLDPRPVQPTSDYYENKKKLKLPEGPRKRSSKIPIGVKKRKARERRIAAKKK